MKMCPLNRGVRSWGVSVNRDLFNTILKQGKFLKNGGKVPPYPSSKKEHTIVIRQIREKAIEYPRNVMLCRFNEDL
jgi:hypothetical protein